MNAIQGYLFPEYQPPLAAAHTLMRFRNEASHQEAFLRTIVASIVAAGPGSTVVVGCSPAVQQQLLASDLRSKLSPEVTCSPSSSIRSIQFSAPPEVVSKRDQLRALHERYRVAADQLLVEQPHRLEYSPRRTVYSTEVEAVADMLNQREIGIVCLTNAENLTGNGSRCGRTLDHICDLARRSGVSHVVFGERAEIGRMRQECRANTLVVLQPLFNPDDKNDVTRFTTIVNAYDKILAGNREITLANRVDWMMKLVGGDPCRLAQWLAAAVCQAAQAGATKLNWEHIRRVQPGRPDVNRAAQELFQDVHRMDSSPISEAEMPAAKSRKERKKKRRPGRNPGEDGVPPAAAA